MNKLLLESTMKLFGDTGSSLSEYLGISRSRFSAKLNEKNGAEFTQGEIRKIRDKYKLSAEAVFNIFFDEKVSK